MSAFLPALRRVAFQAPSRFFVCNQCLRQPPRAAPSSRILQAAQSRFFVANATGPVNALAAEASAAAAKASAQTKYVFPKTTSKAVGYWLIGSAVSVFGIVVWGGLTRLTESGLSITEWKPVTGSMPPRSQQDWEAEFERYRASPEFKILNPHMTVDEFKKIYFMEWSHRLWGRVIGMSFVLPTLYFMARRRVSAKMAANLLGISSLIGFQGFIGWWMVKSGLKDDLFAEGSHPRVSQYRLTAHLGTAFICYSWMLLSGLAVLRARRMAADPRAALAAIKAVHNPVLANFRRTVLGVTALIFVTAMSGALVAGLDAGLIYNEFPKMGLGLTPPASELWDKFYARRADGSDLWWRNMLENPSTVQMDHRILAVSTFCAILALFVYSRRGRVGAALPKDARKGALGLVHLVCMQVALGITTLIYMVPIPLGAAHQAGSLAVLSGALVLAHRLHVPKSTVRALEQKLKHMKPQ
ncbi:cytochrome c oxidase assembly protein, putative [Cordyceps militaris CM01]|uniref:Cytochrome c oxidase assembly protein, putative n=2 Tax=Cordyceps militaris TaxID=73501 RepID=G3JHJ3_CORMM|nr:cytochrome c oxidase assembly protein, putative [Cordyceps militaris CM01]ATY59606.1 cytochrome c oxidase assembly [Cordyceps militaris]EGX90901.1 cytochrome c oxidase assembly protein, putative [Cordyceps militaris CM01]